MFSVLDSFIQQLPKDAPRRMQELTDIELQTRVGIALGLAIVFTSPEHQERLKTDILMDTIFVADIHRKPKTTVRILKDAKIFFQYPEDQVKHVEVGTYINRIVSSVTEDQHLVSLVYHARSLQCDLGHVHKAIRALYFDGLDGIVTEIQKEDESRERPVDGSFRSKR